MCARLVLADVNVAAVTAALGEVGGLDVLRKGLGSYNVAPSRPIPVLRGQPGALHFEISTWGVLVQGKLVVNARSETLAARQLFRDPLRDGRCVVVCQGFYEWKHEGKMRRPYFFRSADGGPLMLGGLVLPAERGSLRLVVVTRAAGPEVSDLHDREPMALGPSATLDWLRDGTITPPGSVKFDRMEVGIHVNSVNVDSSICLEPPGVGTQLRLLDT